jgi:superfamily II DNA or RNA helicase
MSNIHFVMTIYSHHFIISKLSPVGRMLCNKFASRYVQYGLVPGGGVMHRRAIKVFAAANNDRSEYRFHINQLSDWYKLLLQYGYDNPTLYKTVKPGIKPTVNTQYKVDAKWKPRDYQIPIIEYLSKPLPVCKLVGLATGRGKTASALMAVEKIQKMPCIIVKPAYIEKWIEDLIKTYNLALEDIMVIQGGKHLTAFLTKVAEGSLEYKAVIISNKTFQLWLTLYEKHKEDTLEMGYVIHPHQFFEHANCGVRLIDEVHQDFHFNFKLDLYTNVEYAISLSATLITADPFLKTMHDIAYPIKDRCPSPPLHKYVHSYAVHYRFKTPQYIRTSERGSNNYAHGALEKSVMKSAEVMKNYLALIDYTIAIGYLKSVKEGKKCIIFAYSVEMCTKITEYLVKRYPDYIVKRYVAEDEYDNLMQSDIVVSTLGSAGTAVDIPDLTNVILTTAIDSIQSNIQSLGRLRELDNGATPTEFHYFVCDDVPKHLDYHTRKKAILSERAKTFIDVYSGFVV